VLNFPWDEVHAEAERLEHAASDALIDRMADAMGEPCVDPHGAPIPTREGQVDERPCGALSDVAVGACARIVRVSDEDPARLRYLAELGLVPGADVTVVSRAPYEGPIELRVGDAVRAIGPTLAADIYVES
jgi:DtxR family transcriptional regulator, Mn-dependent transcriptional regulator